MDFNKTILIGKVKDKPTIFDQGGSTRASFILIVNDRQPDANGQWVDNFIHVPVYALDKKAELVRDFIVAGQELTLDCRYINWVADQTQQHGFIINSVSFGFKPRQDNQGAGAPQMQGPPV
jgi:single-stranded DNA-binding protein